jgi:N-acetylmuramoyl-L-alanine amidase
VRAAVAAALLVAATLPANGVAATRELEGRLRTSERPDGRPVEVVRIDGVDHLDLLEIARLFRATRYWRAELGKMVLKIGERRVTVTVGSPFVYVDAEGTSLLAPVVWHEGRIFAPVALATRVLDPLVPERVTWVRDRRELRVLRGDPNVLGFRWDLRGNGTLVAIRLAEPLDAELAREPGRAVVRVPGGVLAETVPAGTKGIGLVDSVEVAEEPDAALFTFHLAASGGIPELFARTGPPRLELIVPHAAAEDADGGIPAPEFETPVAFPPPRDVRVVVLDPGHGGSDEGARSEGKLTEKEVTLAVARRAAGLLREQGFEVHLTREEDRFVSQEARARLANAHRADVFLSIHANAWFDPELEGFAVGLSARPPGPAADPGQPRPWGRRDTTAANDAETLADVVSSRLGAATGRPNRGVRADALAPLSGVSAPAAVVECGFLTNEGDAKRLAEPAFQDKIARALAEALREYRDALAGTPPGEEP